MKNITRDSVNALMNDLKFKRSNTKVEVFEGYEERKTVLRLHGNPIIVKIVNHITEDNFIYFTNAGWSTSTTKERLNGIPGINICQMNWKWYVNSKEWDGTWCKYNPSSNELKFNVQGPVL